MKNRLYPHLSPADIAVWERFLHANPKRYSQIFYDIRVGQGRDPGETLPDKYRKMALDLSMRRIDAVGHHAAGVDIIEITPALGFRALGQCQTYPLLFAESIFPTCPVHMLVVCEYIGTDIKCAVERSQLHCELFPENSTPTYLNRPPHW